MKPRKLKIMGLNSFNEEQEIDFSILTEKGFFGIFGPTGSGKSTILDAITIALYGEISRSSKNKLEFINSDRNDMNIYYEFEMGSSSNRKIYTSERHYKRKKDGGIACDRAVLRDITTDEKEILSEGSNAVTESITGLIGLKCDDFTRSVVLPQGKFSDFLKLTKGDRGKMLERILNLEEFGSKIAFKVKGEIAIKKSELDVTYGAMSRYEGLSTEKYEEMKSKLMEADQQLVKLKIEKQQLAEDYDKYKAVWQEQQELKGYEDRKLKLLERAGEMELARLKLKTGRAALLVKPYMDNLNDTINKLEQSKLRMEKLDKSHKTLSEQLEKTKSDYLKAYETKERELPIFIEKEARLNEAVKFEVDISGLEKEIKSLRQQYQAIKTEAAGITEELSKNQQEKEILLSEIDSIIEGLSKGSITSEYRERVHGAVEVEREYNETSRRLKDQNLKIQELGAHLVKDKSIHQEMTSQKEALEGEILELNKLRKSLSDAIPGTNEDIVAKTSQSLQLKNDFERAKDTFEGINGLKQELQNLELKRGKLEGQLEELAGKLKLTEAKLDQYEKELKRLERADMAGHLAETIEEGEACPVCGSIHHPRLAELVVTEDQNRFKNEIAVLKKEFENGKLGEANYKMELSGIISELKLKQQAMAELTEKLGGSTLQDMEKATQDAQTELVTLKSAVEKYEVEVKKADEKVKSITEEMNLLKLEYIKLTTTLGKDEELFNAETKSAAELKEKFIILEQRYVRLTNELGVSNILQEYERLNKSLREAEESRKREQQLRNRIFILDGQRNELETKKALVSSNLEQVGVTGREKTNEMNRLITRKEEYSENRNPAEYLSEIKRLASAVKELETKLKQSYEEENQLLIKVSEDKVSEAKNHSLLKDTLTENSSKLNQMLSENGFENSEAAQNAFLLSGSLDELDREIQDYDNKHRTLLDNISRLHKKLEDRAIDEVTWGKLLGDRQQNEVLLEEITKYRAAQHRDLESMERDFEDIKQLEKQRKEQEKEMALLNDIMDLISGNKFVEFAATNQLKYIAMEASKRLGIITRGRYALELDSSNEFVMRDDFNGGIRRSSDTLSGGETFLTSLCLALSLSSNIQLKGSAPLEFFFLDEGFGTLDTELLEVVISSLERLRNDRLCVGIISHVEELKARVPVKLLLQSATIEGNGSKVTIEYS